MEEVEQRFRCPHCNEWISMILDTSVEGHQTYIEDCEVCCRPIQISYSSAGGEIVDFFGDGA